MKRCPQTKKDIIESVGAITQTREQLCKQFGITPQTLKNWRDQDPEFDAAFTVAESNCQAWERESWQKFLHTLEGPALKSLQKLIKGYDVTVTKDVYKVKHHVDLMTGATLIDKYLVGSEARKMHVKPSLTAIMFVLTNIDPKYFER